MDYILGDVAKRPGLCVTLAASSLNQQINPKYLKNSTLF